MNHLSQYRNSPITPHSHQSAGPHFSSASATNCLQGFPPTSRFSPHNFMERVMQIPNDLSRYQVGGSFETQRLETLSELDKIQTMNSGNCYKTSPSGSTSGSVCTNGVLSSERNSNNYLSASNLIGSSSRDNLIGSTSRDNLIGSSSRDNLIGSSSRDNLIGSSNRDNLIGNSNRDNLIGSSSRDNLIGSSSRDNLIGSSSRDNIIGSSSRDNLIGSSNRDIRDESNHSNLMSNASTITTQTSVTATKNNNCNDCFKIPTTVSASTSTSPLVIAKCMIDVSTMTDPLTVEEQERLGQWEGFAAVQSGNKVAEYLTSLRQFLKLTPPGEKKRQGLGDVRIVTSPDGSRLYCCSECQMAYPDKTLLEQHLAQHKVERRFICNICGAGLKRKEHLDRHQLSHSQERPFTCGACPKTFKRNEHLARHYVTHSGEKHQVCTECGKAFYRRDHLQKHFQGHLTKRLRMAAMQTT